MVCLIILDGWGYSSDEKGNAIALAKKPNYDYMWQNYPHTLLQATGKEVGLPWGEIGNSEVGHLSIGTGRIVYQSAQAISRSIYSGQFYENQVIKEQINNTKKKKKSLHLIGLASSGGVHSHIDHLLAILEILHREKFKNPCYIHIFTDGRDTSPKSANLYIDKIEKTIEKLRLNIKIASVSGRYFAMDRDSRWPRTIKAYQAITKGVGPTAFSAEEAANIAYKNNLTDEFIEPTVILDKDIKKPIGTIQDGDSVFFFNFRPERIRQLVEMFAFKKLEFPDVKIIPNLDIITMMQYEKSYPFKTVFPSSEIQDALSETISKKGLTQLHLAETEKYAHVTYFFDGWKGIPSKGEKWAIVPSPKVSTYDKMPQMSAPKIVDRLKSELRKQKYDFVLINFANADMVGHTGKIKAAIKAVEAIDKELGRLKKLFEKDIILITADHGNAEKMLDDKDQPNTEHEINPVPFLLVDNKYKMPSKSEKTNITPSGILGDVAPTILELLKIEQPEKMTGYSLLTTLTRS